MPKRKPKIQPIDVAAEFEQMLKKTGTERYVLRLYVTGITDKSTHAIANIRAVCDEFLADRYDLQVIDIYQQPTHAIDAQIIAAPTLVKDFPRPKKRMIGDLTDRTRVLLGLDLQEAGENSEKPGDKAIKWVEL